MPGMSQVVFRAPEASVNIHHYREWALILGKAKFPELVGIGAISKVRVSGWRRELQNVFGHEDIVTGMFPGAASNRRFLPAVGMTKSFQAGNDDSMAERTRKNRGEMEAP